MGRQENHEGFKKTRKEDYFVENYHCRRNTGGIRQIPLVDKVLKGSTAQFLMKLISWNVRGLNSPSKHIMIKNMIQKYKP